MGAALDKLNKVSAMLYLTYILTVLAVHYTVKLQSPSDLFFWRIPLLPRFFLWECCLPTSPHATAGCPSSSSLAFSASGVLCEEPKNERRTPKGLLFLISVQSGGGGGVEREKRIRWKKKEWGGGGKALLQAVFLSPPPFSKRALGGGRSLLLPPFVSHLN